MFFGTYLDRSGGQSRRGLGGSLLLPQTALTFRSGQCVYIAIRAMSLDFPNMRNTFGPDAGLTSAQFIGFFVFWLLSLPTLWLPLHRVQILFQIKAAVAPVAAFSYFGSVVVNII